MSCSCSAFIVLLLCYCGVIYIIIFISHCNIQGAQYLNVSTPLLKRKPINIMSPSPYCLSTVLLLSCFFHVFFLFCLCRKLLLLLFCYCPVTVLLYIYFYYLIVMLLSSTCLVAVLFLFLSWTCGVTVLLYLCTSLFCSPINVSTATA